MDVSNNKLIILILWFFFGYLGLHRIFAGRKRSGFIMFSIFTTGVLVLGFNSMSGLANPILTLLGTSLVSIIGIWYLVDLFLFALRKI